MDASSFPRIPLLLPFPSNHHIMNTTTTTSTMIPNDDDDQYPTFPKTTTNSTTHHHSPAAHDEDDDEEVDTLSLCDLPLHSSNHINHPDPAGPDDDGDNEDAFEFSREYSFTADHLALDPTNRDNNKSIVFCGKLIAHRQQLPVQQQGKVILMISNEKKRKQEQDNKKKKQSSGSTGRIFPWKSFSLSSSSSSSNSSCSSPGGSRKRCPPEKKKKRSSSRGYLCFAIGVEWKFPVRRMDLKDIKLRQSRRSSAASLDFDVSTSSSSSFILPADNSTAVGTKSGKGLWCLLRVLAGARP